MLFRSGIGHKVMDDVMKAHALGIEILISGKVPSSRAKRWRFYQGYLKKSGEIALTGVDTAYSIAKLKTGVVGIQVRLMQPDLVLPDNIKIRKDVEIIVESDNDSSPNETVADKKSETTDKPPKKVKESKKAKSSKKKTDEK